MKKTRKPRTPQAPLLELDNRKIWECRTGQDLQFCGFAVVENINGAERILGFAQAKGDYAPYENDAEEQRDYTKMLRHAQRALKEPDHVGSSFFIDYRQYGLPTSERRMPNDVYEWHLYEPGKYEKEAGRQIFPYCPIRLAEMIAARDGLTAAATETREARSDPDELAILIVRETGETWFIIEAEDLLAVGVEKANKSEWGTEKIVVVPSRREILVPGCYEIGDLGSAVWDAIDYSTTRARVNGKRDPA